MNLHCVPTGPGRSRVTYSLFSTVDNKFTRRAIDALRKALCRHSASSCPVVAELHPVAPACENHIALLLLYSSSSHAMCLRPCRRLGSMMPPWMEHLQRHLVFDGDHALLHIQERVAAQEARQPGGGWRKSYWMPTESDRCHLLAGLDWTQQSHAAHRHCDDCEGRCIPSPALEEIT